MKPSSIDPCLWYRVDDENNWLMIGVYSDDNLVVSKGTRLADAFAKHFESHYKESPDSGAVQPGVHEFLGLMVTKRVLPDGVIEVEISSPKVSKKLRDLVGDTPTHFNKTPIVPGIQLNKPVSPDNPLADVEEFNCRSVFGLVLWAAMAW